MYGMFYGCSSLTSLNLSNFNTSKVINMNYMFGGCTNLEYINLLNFDETNLDSLSSYYSNMFDNVPDNVVICINKDKTINKIFPQIESKTCKNIDCTNNWKSVQKKITIMIIFFN